MLFAKTRNYLLTGFGVGIIVECWVFFFQTSKRLGNLALVAFVFNNKRHRHTGFFESCWVDFDDTFGIAKSVACHCFGKFGNNADVTCVNEVCVFKFFAAWNHQFAKAFAFACARVNWGHIGGEFTRNHLEVGHFANKRVGNCFENVGEKWFFFIAFKVDSFAVNCSLFARFFERGREKICDAVE